uniref:F-box associated domain-containing protein n=1 Tax=Oryza brachyantha TaxID=4533 RepID=J3N9R1_ORYBR
MKPCEYAGYSVFWQGALYVHSGGLFVTRFSTSNDKYQIIKTPIIIRTNKFEKPYLGISTKGVSFGFICDWQLSIWNLKESAGQMEWVLNYQHDLWALNFHGNKNIGIWIVEEDNLRKRRAAPSHKYLEWDSDNDDFVEIEDDGGRLLWICSYPWILSL